VAQRAAYATDQELEVIACVGELEEERERGETQEVLRRQVGPIVEAVEAVNRIESLTIAYEPVWAIGTGRTASPEQAQEAHAFIRGLVEKPGGWRINILYGGSVKPDNAAELLSKPDVDGALVGGASLEVESFTAICQAAAGIRL
jgi:triosephosphate isomerase